MREWLKRALSKSAIPARVSRVRIPPPPPCCITAPTDTFINKSNRPMKNKLITFFAGISFIAMIVVNFLANSLPINNRSTGAISDAYPNLFAPAGFTFSIWGLIYLLLAAFMVYQSVPHSKAVLLKNETLLNKLNLLFIATSLANISWIFAWHYDYIGVSVLIMAVLLVLLIKIADVLRDAKMTSQEKWLVATPFSVYFGWITVAAIANITVFLVSIGWNGFGIPESVWTCIILLVGALIAILRIRKDKNIAYGLVLIWAYFGIAIKHLSTAGFDGMYPSVIGTVIVCEALFVFFSTRIFLDTNK